MTKNKEITIQDLQDITDKLSEMNEPMYADIKTDAISITGLAFRIILNYTNGKFELYDIEYLNSPVRCLITLSEVVSIIQNTDDGYLFKITTKDNTVISVSTNVNLDEL